MLRRAVTPLRTSAVARACARPRQLSSESTPIDDEIGLGVVSDPVEGVTARQLFKAMMFHIDGIDRFYPVSSVSVRAAHGAAAEEGAVWRSMKFNGPGPLQGKTIVQHIYADREQGKIRFVGLEGKRQKEGPLEEINLLRTDPLCIEYYQWNRLTKERVHWTAPRSSAIEAIEATVRLAKAAENHAAASDDFGGKA